MITIPRKFKYYTKPYEHQREDFERSKCMPYFGFFNEMGTGKSKPILDTAAHLYLTGEIDGVLIISDKGCYLNWHIDQIPIHLSPTLPYRSTYWASTMDRAQANQVESLLTAQDDCLDLLCINVEALAHPRGFAFAEKFLRSHYSMMVVDESSSIKNLKAQRTRACLKLGQLADFRRVATGTPMTQSPIDLFAQCEFLQPGSLGFNSFVAFRSYYAVTQKMNPRPGIYYETILAYRNLEQLTKSIQPFTSRRLKSECLDLPEKIYERCYVEHTAEQRALYQKLKQEALLQFDAGIVSITSALTMLGKLHQINCGHIKLDDDGDVVRIPSNRATVLMELLEKIQGKVIIWAYFKEDVRIICEELTKAYGINSFVHYYGDTSADDRPASLKSFVEDPICRFFVATPSTGGKGLNGLTAASTAIYYTNHYKLEARLQSEDRMHRIGQSNKCTYIDLVTRGTVDVPILDALRDKRELATQVLDTLRQLLTQ